MGVDILVQSLTNPKRIYAGSHFFTRSPHAVLPSPNADTPAPNSHREELLEAPAIQVQLLRRLLDGHQGGEFFHLHGVGVGNWKVLEQ